MFVVGSYCEIGKLPTVSDFLNECLSELNLAMRNGIQICARSVRCTPSFVICNTLGRVFIQQTKEPTSHFGCDRCIQRDKQMTLSYTKHKSCDDISSRLQRHRKHQAGVSQLVSMPVDTISTSLLDYMDPVCFGIVNKSLALWLHSPLSNHYDLRRSDLETLDRCILVCGDSLPYSF